MDIAQLEAFLAVAEEHSFSRAAQRLGRTQPAVSQVIRKLEMDLGEVLFERALRDGTLTAAGEVLREYASRLLLMRNEAASAVAELRSLERGRLTIAANEYTCLYLLPVLDRFRAQCPQITVTVQRALASCIPKDLLARSAEFGVLSFRPSEEDFRSIVVYTDTLALVMSPRHALAKRKRVRIAELGAESFVAHNVPSPLRRQVVEAFERHQAALNIGVELPSIEAVKRFVALGNGVALVPALAAARELETGELVKVPVPELKIDRHLRVVHRSKTALSYTGVAFLKTVRAFAAERRSPFHFQPERGEVR